MKILITGVAGFIGYSTAKKILKNKNYEITGIDNLNSYYQLSLKKNRLENLFKYKNFKFLKVDIVNKKKLSNIFKSNNFNIVLHFAAQAGVRYSYDHPEIYLKSNVIGFFNIINFSKIYNVEHFIFASSSSVYGNSATFPTKEINSLSPESIYASTKIHNENLAYNFSKNYNLNVTGLRFFTVYGPYGRPDMSIFKFTNKILNKQSIQLYNNGDHYRDFTYIDDVTNAVSKLIKKKPQFNIPFNIINIGSGKTVFVGDIIKILEKYLKSKANIIYEPFQKGDVFKTHSNVSKLRKIIKKYNPINVNIGLKKYLNWHKKYYSKP